MKTQPSYIRLIPKSKKEKPEKYIIADENTQEELLKEFLNVLYRCLLINDKIETESEYQYFIFKNQRIIKSLLWELGFNQKFKGGVSE